MTAEKLRQRISKVEALYLGAATAGERAAAGHMLRRLRDRLAEVQPSEDCGAAPSGEHLKWRQSRGTRDARGRWTKSTSNGEVHHDRNDGPDEQQDGSITRMTFRLSDRWTRYLLLALARQYRVRTYRHRRWPEMTLVLAGPEEVLDELSLQFDALSRALASQLARTTRRTIADTIGPADDVTWLRWSSV